MVVGTVRAGGRGIEVWPDTVKSGLAFFFLCV